jgi:hypothetical protein
VIATGSDVVELPFLPVKYNIDCRLLFANCMLIITTTLVVCSLMKNESFRQRVSRVYSCETIVDCNEIKVVVFCIDIGALSLDKIPERLVLVGGGVIGLEMVSTRRRRRRQWWRR